jgi:hypothetical protein
MGAVAAGRYLQQLRDYARLSRAEVATQVRDLTGTATNDVQIFRIERGMLDTKGTVLMAMAQIVGANLTHIQQLLLDQNTTEEQGLALAAAWIVERGRPATSVPNDASLALFGKTRILGRMLRRTGADLLRLQTEGQEGQEVAHVYEGRRAVNTTTVTVDGEELAGKLGWQAAPFEWGFSGSGPLVLARAILTCEFGSEFASQEAPRFAADVVAALPREQGGLEWVLDSEELATWRTLVRLAEEAQHG